MTKEKKILCDENHCFCETVDEHGDNVCILDSIAEQTTAADQQIKSPHVTDMFPQVNMTDEEWQDDYSFWCD